nr:ATP12 family protein [Telmatospirillum sp. J64-1]
MKRFYKQAGVAEAEGGFAVTLDGRSVRTPMGQPLTLPSRGLAEAIAEEWGAQAQEVAPETMPCMQLASTALDRIEAQKDEIIGQLMKYAGTDLLCYRADQPQELIKRQDILWQPLLDWVAARWGVQMAVTRGIIPVEQSPEAIDSLRQVVLAYDNWQLSALQSATAAAGSLIIALALVEGRLSAAEAFAVSQVDETWQIEQWGEDPEATRRRAALEADVHGAARFLSLL